MENCFRRDLLLYCTLYAGISAGYRCVSMDQMIRASFHLIVSVSVITNGSNHYHYCSNEILRISKILNIDVSLSVTNHLRLNFSLGF